MLQLTSLSSRIVSQNIFNQLKRYTTAPNTVILRNSIEKVEIKPLESELATDDKSSKLVAAAFASLKSEDTNIKNVPKTHSKVTSISQSLRKNNATDDIIQKAITINELLKIAENPVVSRRHALKIVSILADWSATNKCKLIDFETDPRFTKLCRILGRNNKLPQDSTPSRHHDDLSTVLGVTGDDEAAKLIASITVPQMVKVLTTLAQKRRRSIPLLRSVTNNLTKSQQNVLNLKECADVLYSAAILTYPEIPLLEKVAQDILLKLPENVSKSAVVGSILTSIGILRYRNTELLDVISEWVVKYNEICRPQDIFALLITLATVNYQPANIETLQKQIVPTLNSADALKSTAWLDLIWSLLVLNIATKSHIDSVLRPEFITKLKDENSLSVVSKLKLLNIQAAAATLIPNYPSLTDPDITTVTITRSREKQSLVAAMLDSLGNLLPITYLRSNIDTGMGFILDGECLMDSKCNPLSFDSPNIPDGAIKIAFIAYDFHDFCRGSWSITGMNEVIRRLLEAKGYHLVTVPYLEFNPRDKLIKRVQYLEKALKECVKNVK